MTEHLRKLTGKIALVTGASRGIGQAAAIALAKEGAHVILVARTQGGLEETDDAIRKIHGKSTIAPMNLRDFERIDQLGAAIAERFKRLDILVGNAGILGMLSPAHHLEPEVWQEVMDVNLTANWRLIRSFDPLLRASDAGRAIFVTSGVTNRVYPFWSAYAASKSALESLVKTYAAEVKRTNLRANLLDPGIVETAMRAKAFPGETPGKHKKPEDVAASFIEMALPSFNENGEVITLY